MSENNAQSSQLFHLFQMTVMMAVDKEVDKELVGVIMMVLLEVVMEIVVIIMKMAVIEKVADQVRRVKHIWTDSYLGFR